MRSCTVLANEFHRDFHIVFRFYRAKERRGSRVYVLSLAAILTMFALALVLWTLDLSNFIVEAKITLVEDSDETIDDKYGRALAFIFRLVSAQDALYAYMVSARLVFRAGFHNRSVVLRPCLAMPSSYTASGCSKRTIIFGSSLFRVLFSLAP